jgi:membrane protein YdbS with pleckstrin-like domain
MALVTCPECGQQVSTAASACPHCGMVLSAGAAVGAASPVGSVFAPAAGPSVPEQSLWEGRPSVALVYGKVLRLIIRAVVVSIIGYLVITAGLPAVASIFADIRTLIEGNAETVKWAIIAVLVLAMVPSLIALPVAVARLKSTQYKVTNQRILVERGVLSKSLEEIDMRSVDDTEFRQTFLERIFGIGEVWVVSTDKVAPRVVLHGIHDPRKIRELIRANAYQASQRQLFTRST